MEYVLVIALTPVLMSVSLLLKNRFVLPLLCSIPVYLGYLLGLKTSTLNAFFVVLLWTLVQTALVLLFSYQFPDRMRDLILKSEIYTTSMFRWIETGMLPEGDSRQVIRFHIRQAVVYCVFATISGNCISLLFGCILLNHMNYYVSQLAKRSGQPWKAMILGWNFWSIIRVLSFLWLGVALGVPVVSHFANVQEGFQWLWLAPGIAGIACDVLLKVKLSERWRLKLAKLISLG